MGAPVQVSAASKLRDSILSGKNMILLVRAGFPDEVIRVSPIPKYILDEFKKDHHPCLILNLDNGPQGEAWTEIQRQIDTLSRRDRPIPRPAKVCPTSKEEWSLAPEDVPSIELVVSSEEPAPVTVVFPESKKETKTDSPNDSVVSMEDVISEVKKYKCDSCDKSFDKERALRMHKMHHVKKMNKK